MTNDEMTLEEWTAIHEDGSHEDVCADGDREDEFGYRVADCPLCNGDVTS